MLATYLRGLLLSSLLLTPAAWPAPTVAEVDCSTHPLQDAIDAAHPGSVIRLTGWCEGHFTVDKDLTILGAPAVLSGIGDGTVLTLTNGTTPPLIYLKDLEIRNGGLGPTDLTAPMAAGGLLLLNSASEPLIAQLENVTIADNTLPGNDGDAFGACGVGTSGPVKLTLRNSAIINNGISNISLDGHVIGGLHLGLQGYLQLYNTELSGNFNLTDGGSSGGLECYGHCIMQGGHISDNETGSDSGSSGAGFTVWRDGFLLMEGVRVQDNRSSWDTSVAGGGVILGHAVLKHTQIRNNQLLGTGDTDGSGGLLVQGGVLEMMDSAIRGNWAPGVYHRGAAGLTVRGNARASLLRTTIRDNLASLSPTGANAGALLVSDDSQFYGNEVIIRNNEGQTGSVHIGEQARVILTGSRVQGNLGLITGGIWLDDTASPPGEVLLFNTSLINNTPDNCSGFTDPACL